MNCAQYEKYLSSYIDNELKDIIPAAVIDEWTAQFEQHLQTCDACQQEYQNLLRAKQQLNALPDVPLTPALEQQVMAFLRSAPDPASDAKVSSGLDLKQILLDIKVFVRRFFTPPRLVIAGSAFVVVFLWLGFFNPLQKPATQQVAQDINLEKLMDKHMETVIETTNPAHQSGVLILYNKKILEMGQPVNYDK